MRTPAPTPLTIAGMSLALLIAAAPLAAWAAPSAEELYRKGETSYQQNKLQQANNYFRQVNKALDQRKAKLKQGTMPWNLMEFGQLNVLYLMSDIAWKSKLKRRSCRLYDAVYRRLQKLPKGWQQWQVQEDARKRLQQAQQGFKAKCDPVPSLLLLTVTPSNAKVERSVKGKWQALNAVPNKPAQRQLEVTGAPTLQLRVSAPGFLPQTTKITMARWRKKTSSVTLKAKPKPRRRVVVAVRRAPPKPPPPVPVYKKGWFWAVIGIGSAAAIGGVIAGVVVSQQPYTEGLRNGPNDPGFSLW